MRAALLLVAIPALVSAQTTTTNCMVNGQMVNCTTQGPMRGVDARPTDFASQLGPLPGSDMATAPVQAQPAPPQMQAAWAHVADLIKAHRCDEAVDFAIRQ